MEKNIENKIKLQIEDIMLSENINEKESIKYLMDYYSNNDCTCLKRDSVIKLLNSLMDLKGNL